MATYKGFEETRVWQHTRDLVRRVFSEVESAPVASEPVLKEGLKAQAVRISTMISDGCQGGDASRRQSRLRDAQGAAAAVRAQAVHCQDLNLLSAAFVDEVREATMSIGAQLGAWLRTMRQKSGDRAGHATPPRRTSQAAGGAQREG